MNHRSIKLKKKLNKSVNLQMKHHFPNKRHLQHANKFSIENIIRMSKIYIHLQKFQSILL